MAGRLIIEAVDLGRQPPHRRCGLSEQGRST
jgi:hypothetical protein